LTSEGDLIRRAQAGDRDAFCLLARGYERRVLTLALYYCRDPHDAEDLSQEVWLKAFRALGTFRGESSFYTWLRQITVNSFLNYRRGAAMTPGRDKRAIIMGELVEVEELGLLPAGPAAQPEEALHQKMLVARVLEALDELTPQQRLIFLLKHREGMTYDEISAAVGTSAGTIKKALFRAVAKLREHLGVAKADSYEARVSGH
jgi:RNA polymerase sigma-70 factor (ECF subfamily)